MSVTAQGPAPTPPQVPPEIGRGSRNAPHTVVQGIIAGVGDSGGGNVQGLAISTSDKLPQVAIVPGTEPPPLGYEHGEAAYLAAKEAAHQIQSSAPSNTADVRDSSAANQPDAPAVPQAPPAGGQSYEAVYYTGWIPPDPIIVATPSDIMVAVNKSFYIANKSNPGTLLYSTTLNSWFGLSSNYSVFDPKLVYDFINNRVILVALATDTTVTPNRSRYAVSVSRQSSAMGNWYTYTFDATLNGSTPTNNWADYPGVGTDGTNLYITANMFDFGGAGFQYSKVRMFKLSELYAGSTPPGWWDFWAYQHADARTVFTLQPAHHYLSGPPMYFIAADNNLSTSSGNILTTFRIDGYSGWPGTPPSFVRVNTFTTSNAFSVPPNASQPGTSTLIETGDDRILSARYWGGDIWATQTCTNSGRSALCVYGVTTGGFKFFDTSYGWGNGGVSDYYYPAIALDRYENVAIVFSRSSASEYASIRYTGMMWNESFLQNSAQIKAGEDTYINVYNGRNRWGDYTGIERDPLDGQTFWMFNEYAKPRVSGVGRWSTWIFTAYFPYQLYLPLILK